MDRSSFQGEANRPDSAVVAEAASGVNPQDSSFPSQDSEAVETPVRSYQSPVQQMVMRRDRKSGLIPSLLELAGSTNCYLKTDSTRPRHPRKSLTELAYSDFPYPECERRSDWEWRI